MDDAGRYTAEHTLMDANLEIGQLKHLLVVAEDKIEKLEKENAELKKQLTEKDDVSIINYGLDPDLLELDIGKKNIK
jgi:hypothetical protein|tara:strand:+ start:231 stop:461 length:231 start_codon:yes stop_codon:yes gene_type:complete